MLPWTKIVNKVKSQDRVEKLTSATTWRNGRQPIRGEDANGRSRNKDDLAVSARKNCHAPRLDRESKVGEDKIWPVYKPQLLEPRQENWIKQQEALPVRLLKEDSTTRCKYSRVTIGVRPFSPRSLLPTRVYVLFGNALTKIGERNETAFGN